MAENNETKKTLLANQDSTVINGHTYVCQYPGREKALDIVDYSQEAQGKTSVKKMAKGLMDFVIVEPRCTFETFDDPEYINDFNDVIAFASEVLNGNFPNKK